MDRLRTLGATALLVFLSSAAPAADRVAAAIQKKEDAALKKCAAEILSSAKKMAAAKAFTEAREELRVGMRLAPLDRKCAKQFGKLASKTTETPEAAEDKIDAIRDAVHAKCAGLLAPVLGAWADAERPGKFGRLATATVALLGDAEPLSELDLTWYEPYLLWSRPADIERWKAGAEFHDGTWINASAVKELDAKHADWSDPWIVSDGIQEVRTTMPLRAAMRVSHHVRAYRRFVIDYFAGEWEWEQPSAVLPIYLTATQADYQARLGDYDPAAVHSKASAIYVQKTGGICPVFLTFQPKGATDGATIGWDALLRDVRHEVAHQLLYESCMAKGAGVGGAIDWVSEGVATYLASHRPKKGRWRLGRRAQEPYGSGFEPGPFAWVKGNFDGVKKLDVLVHQRGNLASAYEYFVATTACYFLLDGQERRYRASMIGLLEDVHMAKGDDKSFDKHFSKVDADTLQQEWKDFVLSISIQK